MEDSVRAAVARLTRSGRLPLAGLGERGARALQSSVTPSLRAWRQQLDRYAHPAPRRRSEEHTSELQSQSNLVCRLLLEKKNRIRNEYSSRLYVPQNAPLSLLDP